MKRSEIDKTKLTPMMVKYLEIKERYADAIIFYRLGDFYEMFFEDAILCSRELELTLTSRSAGLDEKIPMCGVPHHSYLPYLEKLVEKGYKVAICEQLSDPKESKGIVDRDVVQVVTKGTIIDNALSEKDNNFIGNIYDFDYCYGLSYADISTGEFFALLLEHDSDKLTKEISNKGIKEVIANNKIDRQIVTTLKENYSILVTLSDNVSTNEEYQYISEDVTDVRLKTVINHLLYYILETKKGNMSHLQKVSIIDLNKYLLFDNNTKKNLELIETIRMKERTYSLLWLLDKTKTAMGSRLLKQSIENPLTNIEAINKRYDMVQTLLTEFILKSDLQELLDEVYDLERLAGRITYGNLNARDLIQLRKSLKVLPAIKVILKEINFYEEIDTFEEVYELLEKALLDSPPLSIKEGDIIRENYSKELDELRSIRSGSKDFILQIEQEERQRTGIKNLKLGYNRVFGYYIEVTKGNVGMIKDEFNYERKQTLANCERFITPLLKEKENIILNAEEKIVALEYSLFMELREEIKKYISLIQVTAKKIALIDMLTSFATVSEENNYTRPKFTKEKTIDIKEARHPVVEKVLKEDFVPNDIYMNNKTDVLLITGPNMAGKSTYMRTLATIIIMAQIGSFVPAKSCNIFAFDKIFTRIGASDDLVSGDSTFMIEMREANQALENATDRSLIIFDELGRGTATYDGMSLAQAILEYVHDTIKAKTLFSTHYHELTSLAADLKRLKNIHVSAIEEEGKITFLHKIKMGSVDKSYGIHVAALANLPKEVIKRAEDILSLHETKGREKKGFKQIELFTEVEEKKEDTIIDKINEINPLEITPIEAINILYELKQQVKKK